MDQNLGGFTVPNVIDRGGYLDYFPYKIERITGNLISTEWEIFIEQLNKTIGLVINHTIVIFRQLAYRSNTNNTTGAYPYIIKGNKSCRKFVRSADL
jgi:hypothetical protein